MTLPAPLAACPFVRCPLWGANAFGLPERTPWVFVVNYAFPAAIIALAAIMMISHWRAWRASQSLLADETEQAYQRRRYRRRMQTSGLLAMIGAALIVGQRIPAGQRPAAYVLFWCGVVLLVLWVVLLAGADVAATRVHIGRLLRERAAERSRLHAELLRKKRAGKQPEPPPGSPD